jgi:putative OPT family oligopeptide transporter
VLAAASGLGGLGKLIAASGLRLVPDAAAFGAYAGRGIAYMGTNLSPALLGVGYIVGLNIGIVVVGGSILSWDIAIPIYSAFFLDGNPELAARLAKVGAEDAAAIIWSVQIRYLGVGAMLVGGIWTLISLRNSLLSGVRSGLEAARAGASKVVAETEKDLPMKAVLIGLIVFTLPLAGLYHAIVQNFFVSIPMTLIMIVAGFLFSSVSAYMAGLVGSSNNPVSGITIGTILFASLVLAGLMGSNAPLGPVAAIVIGAVVCCAAAVAGDNLQDLKCGYMIGATPWRQQLMLAIGAMSCALVMAPVLNLLAKAYGIGVPTPDHPNPLLAPQATLMASVAKGLFGGELPWDLIWIGVAIGAAIIICDEILKKRGANFRTPVLAAAVGIYLPLDLTVPIFLGGLLAHLVERAAGVHNDPDAAERTHRKGVLFSAGLITGEALMGIIIAIPIVGSGRSDVLALPESLHFGELVGLAIFALVSWILYRVAVKGALTSSS